MGWTRCSCGAARTKPGGGALRKPCAIRICSSASLTAVPTPTGDDGSEWSTYFLATWLLKREALPLEEGVRRITSVPAQICGLADRGVIAPGYAADLVLFDPETLALGAKTLVGDLPGDSRRWQVEAQGIHQVIVNGQTIVKDGALTGSLPGQVLRPTK